MGLAVGTGETADQKDLPVLPDLDFAFGQVGNSDHDGAAARTFHNPVH